MSDLLHSSWLRHLLIGIVVAVMVSLLARLMGGLRPAAADGEGDASGRIAPSKALVSIIVLICLAIGGLALYFGWFGQGAVAALIIGLAFLLGAASCATSLLPIYDIVWDAEGIEGATSLWFPPIGPKRRRLRWRDIVAAGPEAGGGWHVADKDGMRIRWNWIYPGYRVLMRRIETECPWLFVDGPGA